MSRQSRRSGRRFSDGAAGNAELKRVALIDVGL